jgi:hypothetical protein
LSDQACASVQEQHAGESASAALILGLEGRIKSSTAAMFVPGGRLEHRADAMLLRGLLDF